MMWGRPLFRARAPCRGSEPVSIMDCAAATPNLLGSVGDRHEQLACRARCCTVHLHPGLACGLLGGLDFNGYWVAGAEVHLVGRLTTKRGVGKTRVVLVHVERDQLLECVDRVERVQVQPLVFERSPPRLDERIGKRYLGHS